MNTILYVLWVWEAETQSWGVLDADTTPDSLERARDRMGPPLRATITSGEVPMPVELTPPGEGEG